MKKIIISAWLILLSGTAQAEWVEYGRNSFGTFYYDPDRAASLQDDIIGIWVKRINSSQIEIDNRRLANLPIKGFEEYSYAMTREVFNCKTLKTGATSISSHSSEGEIIESVQYQMSDSIFSDVIPNSIGEKLMNIVCKNK